jgi:hypothetical protein
MSSSSFIWSGERLRSDALKQGGAPLRCIIPGPCGIPDCEKDGDAARSKDKQTIDVNNLNFIVVCSFTITLYFKPYRNVSEKSKIKGEGRCLPLGGKGSWGERRRLPGLKGLDQLHGP